MGRPSSPELSERFKARVRKKKLMTDRRHGGTSSGGDDLVRPESWRSPPPKLLSSLQLLNAHAAMQAM
mgnify:CR=1 FL=1|jgi:hypothetical protein